MSAYSFLDVVATIDGPGGSINMGADAGVAEEGISIEPAGDKNTMVLGAGGDGQHNLMASDAATITVNLLKTSPINALLMQMYNFQTGSTGAHGRNNITVRDVARGDYHSAEQCAFKKKPTISYAGTAEMMVWTFDSIRCVSTLGQGTPEL